MKTEKSILIAFVLNLAFSVFEFVGGMVTGSTAIMSDAVHDMGDAVSIGISFALERRSKKQPDETYTYGYRRYTVLGSIITNFFLLAGALLVMCHAVPQVMQPGEVDYDGMIVFAVIGVCVNFCAVCATRGGESLHQKSVNLHMLEDVLGWASVLIGAVVMRFTGMAIIDPILSVGIAVFIMVHAVGNLKEGLCLFLEKVPQDVDVREVREHLCGIPGVLDVHHIHIWSMDGRNNYATMHMVTDADPCLVKENVRKELRKLGVGHVTIETETEHEHCAAKQCYAEDTDQRGHHHHHQQHHHHHA